MDLVAYKGFICRGLYFSSGHYLELYCWDSIPLPYKPFQEVWLFTRDAKKICYFYPDAAKEVFKIYHSFDDVIGADISTSWSSEKLFTLTMKARDKAELTISLEIGRLQKWEKGSIEGKTETGKYYSNTPDKIAVVEKAEASLNGHDLGIITKPNATIVAAGVNPVPAIPIINFCLHELEP